MRSQVGSASALPPVGAEAPETPGLCEKIMSAMLTYFCPFVTPEHAFTKGSCSEDPPGRNETGPQGAAARNALNITPDLADDAKSVACRGRKRKEAAAGWRQEQRNGIAVLRQDRWRDLVRRQAGQMGRRQCACAHPRPALCKLRV